MGAQGALKAGSKLGENTTVAGGARRFCSRAAAHDGKILLLRSAMTAPAVIHGAI
jgi:hypothetical protein